MNSFIFFTELESFCKFCQKYFPLVLKITKIFQCFSKIPNFWPFFSNNSRIQNIFKFFSNNSKISKNRQYSARVANNYHKKCFTKYYRILSGIFMLKNYNIVSIKKSKSIIYNVNIPHHLIQKVGIFRVTQQGKFGIPRSF